MSDKVFFCFKFFIVRKCIAKTFIVFLVKSIQYIPQSVSETPVYTPMPAISHLASLGFKPETSENL